MRKILFSLFIVGLLFAACKKTDFDDTVTGEAVGTFMLTSPGTDSITLNPATPDQTVTFKWTAATPGVNTPVKYRLITALRSAGNFETANRVFVVPSDNNGNATTVTLTYKQLEDLLKASPVSSAQRVELVWTVEAYNEKEGSTLAGSSNALILKRSGHGATPFQIFAPSNSLTPVAIDPGSTTSNITFNWTRSYPAQGSPAVRYQLLFAERKEDGNGNELPVNWDMPLFRVSSNNSGADTFVNVSYKALNDSLAKYGFTNPSVPANLKWTVVATSGTWSQISDFSNSLSIVREVKMYIVGSATPGDWDISKSIQMIEDKRHPGTFYLYVFLNAGEMKFVNGQQWPPAAGAVDYGQRKSAAVGELAEQDEDNISISTAGVYRVTVDVTNMKYYLQNATSNGIGGMGMIGGFQGWSHPAVKMDYVTVNRFNYLTNMSNNDEFKFHDGNDWNNSAPNLHRWFGLDNGKLGEDPGHFNSIKYTGPDGLVRAIWDGTDINNLRYTLIPGKLYAIGGDAGLGDWNNSAGNASMPEFTYLGNGKWSAVITVSSGAPFKLVMEKGNWDLQWGAGSTAGTMVMRYFDADPPTFNFPAAGTYTVIVDEYAGTISW